MAEKGRLTRSLLLSSTTKQNGEQQIQLSCKKDNWLNPELVPALNCRNPKQDLIADPGPPVELVNFEFVTHVTYIFKLWMLLATAEALSRCLCLMIGACSGHSYKWVMLWSSSSLDYNI